MSDQPESFLIQTLPDRGPARTIMGLIATVVAVTTTIASYLLGANQPKAAAVTLMLGLIFGVGFFWALRKHILDEECFSASLPFNLELQHAVEACDHLQNLRKDVASLFPSARVRANIFRPSEEDQAYGCAYVLKIDPRLTAEMSDKEVEHIKFLPRQGHTGKAFVTAKPSYGTPDIAITKEQTSNIIPELAYIMSFPLQGKNVVLAVLNLDFCCLSTPGTDDDKQTLVKEVVALRAQIEKYVQDKSRLIAASLARGRLQKVRLMRGV